MKYIQINAPLQAEVMEGPSALLQAGEVRVKVVRAGICGSDAHRFKGDHYLATWPGRPGHEFAGTVTEAAPDVTIPIRERVVIMPMITCGTCPACQRGDTNHCPSLQVVGAHRPGAFASEAVVPATALRSIPYSMSWDEAVLVEPTGIAVHCCHRGDLAAGDRVAVLGAGCIGLLIQQVAKAKGAAFILATGRQEGKLGLARQMGADDTVDVTKQEVVTPERTGSFDLIFDCIGSEEAMEQAIQLARPGGRIVALAVPHMGALPINYGELYRKELSLRASRLYDGDFDEAIPLIASGQVKPLPIVTHRFPLEQGVEAMMEVVSNRRDAIKILLIP
jgi:2-desacetyl-2-hydroxyethyl bacteriochlorophyllide A dehydrogenase